MLLGGGTLSLPTPLPGTLFGSSLAVEQVRRDLDDRSQALGGVLEHSAG
jgi:hypothetical protein